ncbi:MAG: hypothetical protein RI990_721 [Planctomycetota bacterium]|jgi:NAD+ synthetase
MRAVLVPFDSTVALLAGNAAAIGDAAILAVRAGAELVVFPELALAGYPPRDAVLRAGFADRCRLNVESLAARLKAEGAGGAAVVVGTPWPSGPRPANAVAVLRDGRVEAVARKRLLPQYDVFDEPRTFVAGDGACVFSCGGLRVGVIACEDLWRAGDVPGQEPCSADPALDAVRAGAQVVVVPSASPFAVGKSAAHWRIAADAARRLGVTVLAVNALGANDDLVFDGEAIAIGAAGDARAAQRWSSEPVVVEVTAAGGTAAIAEPAGTTVHAERWNAVISGIRGYFRKTGHREAVLGLSGGIDSALVGAMAAAALGGERVTGLLMPSVHSSPGSLADAHELTRRCGIRAVELPIAGMHAAMAAHLAPALASVGADAAGLVDENLQSRLRGVQVMAWSNATGALVLTTGNKSEYAVGYATLYGDMCGALAPIGDLLKTDAWALARWANANHTALGFAVPPIPESSIEKVPSAELRPDQTDQDSLPPYEALDAIVRGWVEDGRSVADIAAGSGIDHAIVARWVAAIDLAEHKRRQAPIIIRLSRKAFGPGRRMPVAMHAGE